MLSSRGFGVIRRRLAALAATLVAVPVGVLPVQAQTCLPPTAEHAFEELLDVAEDDSPLEEEVWRIADEQEAKGDFETPETIRRIDDLARSHGFVYDCGSRMYHPVSGPDPRDAIENGHEPPDADDDEPAGGGSGPAPGREAPGSGGPGAGTIGGTATTREAGGRVPGPAAGETRVDGEAATPHDSRVPESATSTVQSRPGRPTGGQPTGSADSSDGSAFGDGVPRPGRAPDGQDGAVAVTETEESTLPWWAIAIVFLAGTGAILAATARGSRRRSPGAV